MLLYFLWTAREACASLERSFGLNQICNEEQVTIKNRNDTSPVCPVLIAMCLSHSPITDVATQLYSVVTEVVVLILIRFQLLLCTSLLSVHDNPRRMAL